MPENASLSQLVLDESVSEEVKDIISYRPHWIVRHGNVLFLFLLFFLLLVASIIEYPDIVPGSARLVAINAPKLVNARIEGKLERLLVENEQDVTYGEYLAFLESTAKHEQVLSLKEWIDSAVKTSAPENIQGLISNNLPLFDQLGELQDAYQNYTASFLDAKQTFANGFYEKKKKALQNDLKNLETLRNQTLQQQKLQEQDRQLQEKEYLAYESLEKEKVIAPLELNQYKSKLLSKGQTIEQTKTLITSGEISRSNKQAEIFELQKSALDKRQALYSSLLNLKSEIDLWIQQYIVIAPVSGKVLFKSPFQENQLIAAGEELFYVQPSNTQIYAELLAGQRGLGRVKNGQKVIIKVDSYPNDEFGYVTGKVSYISSISNRSDSFLVKVDFPEGLQTNYHKTIYFRNGLSARGEIITDNRNLGSRLLGQLEQFIRR